MTNVLVLVAKKVAIVVKTVNVLVVVNVLALVAKRIAIVVKKIANAGIVLNARKIATVVKMVVLAVTVQNVPLNVTVVKRVANVVIAKNVLQNVIVLVVKIANAPVVAKKVTNVLAINQNVTATSKNANLKNAKKDAK